MQLQTLTARIAVIYARYSTDRQNETSIENQVANCRALAARDGLTVPDERVYSDSAVSGQAKGFARREQWQNLLEALDASQVGILYANELSRLVRDECQGTELMARIKRTGVQVVTNDGIDTRQSGWEMLWMMRLTFSGEEVRQVSKRTASSMLGVVRRGGMLAAPAFGYLLDPFRKAADDASVGARWVRHPQNAEVVKEMYRRRRAGVPHYQIAAWLNREGIPSPRRGRDGQPSTWRQSSVHRLLANTIYRGVLLHNGSAYTRAKLKREFNRAPEVTEHSREELRLVDDQTWFACNPPRQQRLRAGVKHTLVGLLRCGDCGCKLAFKQSKTGGAASCPTCEHSVRAEAMKQWMGYTSVPAATLAMRAALTELFSSAVLEEMRSRLRVRLETPSNVEVERLAAQVRRLNESQQRLVRLAANPDIGGDTVEQQLAETSVQLRHAQAELDRARNQASLLSPAEIRRHLDVDVGPLLDRLLSGEHDVNSVRAVLSRLVRRFVFASRPGKGWSVFEVEFIPGAVTAEQLGMSVLDECAVTFRIAVRYEQKGGRRWMVETERL